MTDPNEITWNIISILDKKDARVLEEYCKLSEKQLTNECRRLGPQTSGTNLIRALALTGATAGRSRAVGRLFPAEAGQEVEALMARCGRETLKRACKGRGMPISRAKIGLAVYLATNPQRRGWHFERDVEECHQSTRARGRDRRVDAGPQEGSEMEVPVDVFAFAEEGDEGVLLRPCVDCGLRTGCFCDECLGSERLPQERWARGQRAPLCSACDRKRGGLCHFCRGQHWATPPTRGPAAEDILAQSAGPDRGGASSP